MDPDNSNAILIQATTGRRKDSTPVEVLAGTLLSFVEEKEVKSKIDFVFDVLDAEKPIRVTCNVGEFRNISPLVKDLLRPIPTCKERLEVYNDGEWLSDGTRLKVGDSVFVKLKGEQSELPGVLKFKGSEVPDSKGIIFGVELKEKKGTSDGLFRRKRFFTTEQDYAVFVSLNKIRKSRDGWHKSTRSRVDENGESFYQQQETVVQCNLRLGERVVWVSDEGPEKGTVQWIGRLPDEPGDNITVGVAFDNPVGTGTGKYKDKRLFYTKQGHASLIPLIGLIKEEEFEHPGSPDIIDVASPEFILQQTILLDQMTLNREQGTLQRSPGPNQKTNIGQRLPESATMATTALANLQLQEQLKKKAQDSSGLNPIYEHTRLNEVTGSTESKGSGNFGRTSNQDPDPDLGVGSMVEVQLRLPLYGVIRWIGNTDEQSGKLTAGLEMEEELSAGTDGTFKGVRYFTCLPKKALFVPLYKCSKDRRFHTSNRKLSNEFGSQTTPDLDGDIPPPEIFSDSDFRLVCGKNRGIQGHHNSCYLDATLFCMFYFTTVFDFIFNRPPGAEDLVEYAKVQKVLKEGIVNPLRRFNYVRADKVLKLRALLDKLGTVPGMMGEEKDPEEFLSALLTQIMKADPLLHLSSGEHTYFYQLFMEKDENLLLPTTQKLVELSFLQGNVKLKQVPSCLMIQMPRFGKEYKMFHRIVPSLQLDITDILENCPRDCIVCGGLATFECKDCYQVHGPGLNTTAFCGNCVKRSHQHKNRLNHRPEAIRTAEEFRPYYDNMKAEAINNARLSGSEDCSNVVVPLPRETMELFAVICIQTSHYVSFVKCGLGKNARWVFFDSMADRMGEQGGYNIPEVVPVPEISEWLAEHNLKQLLQWSDDKDLPEYLRRILCDGYMCMYQSPDVMMYK
ncbi:hypothetical protein BsWGS_15803 [Bradybaena similaris]